MNLQEIISGLLVGGQFALIGLGLSLVLGVLRLVNLAHGELIVGGAYLTLFITEHLGLDPLVAMPLAMLGMALIAYPIQRYLLTGLQLQGPDAPLVATFGLSLIGQAVFQLLFSSDSHSLNAPYSDAGFGVAGVRIETAQLIAFGVAVLLTLAVHLLLTRTRIGTAIRASAQDPQTAGVLGINVNRVYAGTFALSAAIAAAGGVMVGVTSAFDPTSGLELLLGGFAVVALAGIGNLGTILLGGMIIGLLQAVAVNTIGGGYSNAAVYAVFFAVLVIRPTGVLSRGAAW